jgi:uncharacterized protein (TIGR00106 family)
MSVLMQFSMFPTDKGISASPWVSKIIEMIRERGYDYQLTSMATIVETDTLEEAQTLINKAYGILEPDCDRVYCTVAIDIRKSANKRITGKIHSIEERIGPVSH